MLQPRIILIGGPTASGKSAKALELAERYKGSIINADAMQIYAGLPLLTAQPTAQDKASLPHYLYETTDAAEASSVGKWLHLAHDAIKTVLASNRTPILVGGTGLYFDALRGGLAQIPPIPETYRLEVENLYRTWGEEKFREALAVHDPMSASRIARNDRQRLVRAYAVATHTGQPLSAWHNMSPDEDARFTFETHLLSPPRDELYERCDQRFRAMIDKGALDEVRQLMARQLSPQLPAMKILGVRELAAHLRGEIGLKEAIAKAQQLTRHYAKRQMTWFRNQWKDQLHLEP